MAVMDFITLEAVTTENCCVTMIKTPNLSGQHFIQIIYKFKLSIKIILTIKHYDRLNQCLRELGHIDENMIG